jgi:transcriptional/translational regulatory protein YebC/TACO1
MNIAAVMGVLQILDKENMKLFSEFVAKAKAADNPNDFIKQALRRALEKEVEYVVETPVRKGKKS